MKSTVTRSQLGKLALNAAISIERSQNHQPSNISSVTQFLDAISDELDDSESPSILRDETMFPYYSAALAKANSEEVSTRSQFRDVFQKALAKHKVHATAGDHLEQVKQFCLAFHEAMLKASQKLTPTDTRIDGRIR